MVIAQLVWTEGKGQDVVGVDQESLVSDFGTVLVSSCTRLVLEQSQIHYFLILIFCSHVHLGALVFSKSSSQN